MLIYLQSPHKVNIIESESVSYSVVSNSLQPHRLYPTRLLHPWDSPGQNTGVGCYFFSSGSSQPRDWTQVSCIAGRFLLSESIIPTLKKKNCVRLDLV